MKQDGPADACLVAQVGMPVALSIGQNRTRAGITVVGPGHEMDDDLSEQLHAEHVRLGERSVETSALLQAAAERVAALERALGDVRARLLAAEHDVDRLPARAVWGLAAEWARAESELAMARAEQGILAERQQGFDYAVVLLETVIAGLAANFAAATASAPGRGAGGPGTDERAQELDRAAAALVEAQEEERRRVSREIHDGPVQALSNLVLRAEICERLAATTPSEAQAELGRLKRLAASTLRETRRYIFDLRPMILDDLGLAPTVRRYLFDRFSGTGLNVELRVHGRERRLPTALEITLFRVVQAALANVAAHARVAEALVTIAFSESAVRVEVTDRGVGFDVERTLAAAREQRGSGLGLLAERVRLAGGRLRIESALGAGATVEVTVASPSA